MNPTSTTVTKVTKVTTSEETAQDTDCRSGRRAARAFTIYAGVFLVFLLFPLVAVWQLDGLSRWGGVVVIVAFAAWYMAGYFGNEGSPGFLGRAARSTGIWGWLAVLVVLAALVVLVAGVNGLGTMIYIACGAGALAPARQALLVILVSGGVVAGTAVAFGTGLPISLIAGGWTVGLGLMVWGAGIAEGQRQSALQAREEKAELAVELERTRLARDLHDILGHSLTVVAVKAELAGRLIDADPARARTEIADVERLARDALADVRSTVSSYRELSLPAELARARQALVAAGIDAHVPGAADDVTSRLRGLFAWAVREGVTNVVRHSRATTCRIVLMPDSVEILDDGCAADPIDLGNGLVGLAERARQAGATLTTDVRRPRGFRLRVEAGS